MINGFETGFATPEALTGCGEPEEEDSAEFLEYADAATKQAIGEYERGETVSLESLIDAPSPPSKDERMRMASDALVRQLDAIHADERYKSVWVCYMLHGGVYEGPQYEKELNELRAALAEPEATS